MYLNNTVLKLNVLYKKFMYIENKLAGQFIAWPALTVFLPCCLPSLLFYSLRLQAAFYNNSSAAMQRCTCW